MKTWISLLLILAMALSLCACGGKDVETNEDQEQGATQPASDMATEMPEGQSYTGTVSSITETTLVLTTEAGELSFTLTESTLYYREFGKGGSHPEEMGQMPNGMEPPPQMPSGEQQGQQPPQGEPPAMPEGSRPMDPNGGTTPPQTSSQGDTGTTGGFTPGNGNQGGMVDGQDGATPQESEPGMSPPDGKTGTTPPTPPDGDRPDKNQGFEPQVITREEIQTGDTVTVRTDENGVVLSITVEGQMPDNMGDPGGQMGFPGGMDSGVDSYIALTEITTDTAMKDQALSSTAKDENTLHVLSGAQATLENMTLIRDSADSTGGDQASFYGVGAAALVTDGSLILSDSQITTDAPGGTGVFAYGQGTAQVWNTTIQTSKNTSGGIHVAGGGTLYAWDLTVETQGESSAAIRSDRGSGTMVVDGGTYTSNGVGSPAVYSTADITVHNADLTATGSEAICIEGLNTIRLYNCNLSGNMADLNQNDCTWNVILYQSMSGDSEIGNSTFEMVGGTLTAGNGGMFYTTNTESTFLLSDVAITYADENDFFLRCTGNANQRGWGTSGNNGANCTFLGKNQTMEGNVIWDRISQLDLSLIEGSTLRGAVLLEETYAQGSGSATLFIDESSAWIVTADSYVSQLHCRGQIIDPEGNTVTIKGQNGTVFVQGTGSLTVTVDSYDTQLQEQTLQFHTWDTFAVRKPN